MESFGVEFFSSPTMSLTFVVYNVIITPSSYFFCHFPSRGGRNGGSKRSRRTFSIATRDGPRNHHSCRVKLRKLKTRHQPTLVIHGKPRKNVYVIRVTSKRMFVAQEKNVTFSLSERVFYLHIRLCLSCVNHTLCGRFGKKVSQRVTSV